MKGQTNEPADFGLPAKLVGQWHGAADIEQRHGIQLLQVHDTLCDPIVLPGDVIEVDFDRTTVGGDGLYLMSFLYPWQGGTATYKCARHFQFMPHLSIRQDYSKPGFERVTPELMSNITIHGCITNVLRSDEGWDRLRKRLELNQLRHHGERQEQAA